MAAGLGFKTFTTGEVLTAANVNGYLMQGILVFASTAARDSAITAPAEGQFAFTKDTNSLWYYDGAAWVASGATGDIEGVTAGIGISGGGTSGTVTVTNSMATAIDAKGDLIAGTGADAFSRLAVGTNGQVLTANSSAATGLEYTTISAGSMTSIATGTLSGTTTTISSISGSYNHLYLRIVGAQIATVSPMAFTLNGDSGTNYQVKRGATDSTTFQNATATQFQPTGENIQTSANSDTASLLIENYAITGYKALTFRQGLSSKGFMGFGTYYGSTSAITSIGITSQAASANLSVGTYILYGVK